MSLRMILGGITLATAGYGLYRYCDEEGCFDDDTYTSEESSDEKETVTSNDENALRNFFYYKTSIYETTMQEFKRVYEQIKNTDFDVLQFNEAKFELEKLGELSDLKKITKRVKKYSKLLDKTEHLLNNELYQLRMLLEESVDYATYSEAEKKIVENAYTFAKAIEELCHQSIVDDNGKVTKTSNSQLMSVKEIVKI